MFNSFSYFRVIIIFGAALLYCLSAHSETLVVTKISPPSSDDTRYSWNNRLLGIALELTVPEFGPYKIQFAPSMTGDRGWESLKDGRFENLILAAPYDKGRIDPDIHIWAEFPVELGVLGYRVCFYPNSKKKHITAHIKAGQIDKLTFGLRKGWSDVAILRSNGLKVFESPGYENLFHMTAAGRFDLFCRGVTEVYDEYQRFGNIPGLNLDESMFLQYDMPVFYVTNKENKSLIDRIERGLIFAVNNGRAQREFEEHYKNSLGLVNLEKRKIFRLKNSGLRGVAGSYRKYYYLNN